MSGKKIVEGYKKHGIPGAIAGIEPKDVKKAVKTAQELGGAVGLAAGAASTIGNALKGGWDQRRAGSSRESARVRTSVAQHTIRSYTSILKTVVETSIPRDWPDLLTEIFSGSPPPSLKEIEAHVGVPAPSPIERVRKEKRDLRFAREAEARALHEKLTREYDLSLARAKEELDALEHGYNHGEAEAIEFYVRAALKRSHYPEGFEPDFAVTFNPSARVFAVDLALPRISDLPRVSEYRFDSETEDEVEVPLPQNELEDLHEDVLYQLALACLHTALSSSPASHVERAVFNGWVPEVDPRTGRDAYYCATSCLVTREELAGYNLARVRGRDCFHHLKGICEEPLARLVPIKPIVCLNTRDPRFMESTRA